METQEFYCDKCGACCRNLHKSEIYRALDSGNGVCKYLTGNLCSIYETRPLICRIDECYEKFFKNMMTKKRYYQLNNEICIQLNKNDRSE